MLLFGIGGNKVEEMGIHIRERMKKMFPWMVRKRRENGINPNRKKNLVKWERRKTCPESSAFDVMNSDTIL